MQTRRYAATPHTPRTQAPVGTLWHHSTPPVPAQPSAPTLGNHPEPVQPPGREIHTPGKQPKVGGGTGRSGCRGAERRRAASVSVWDSEMENEGRIQRGKCKEECVCATVLEGAEGGCWLEGSGGERWNWRRIKWTLGFRRRRRRGCFERRSGGALLALRLGLRHASRLREATWAWRSGGESAQPLLQWRSGEWQGIPACLTCQSSWLGDPESGRVWRWPSVASEQGRTVLIDENRPREDVGSCFKEKTKNSRWISRWLNVHRVISASKQDRRILGGTLMVAKSKREGFLFFFFSWKTNRNMHDQIWALLKSPVGCIHPYCLLSKRAPFNVTQRREVMKWSNYVSICAIQVKPGVKFPICAPAVSLIHCAFSPVLPVRW